MTFEQALQKKASFKSNNFTVDGMEFYIFVTPAKSEDFKKYCTEVRGYFGRLNDKEAIRYSTDGSYTVNGLCYDGANIVYKTL